MSAPDGLPLEFYRQGDAYGFLSNFAPFPIDLDGRTWPTTEHYFQAQKFRGTPSEERVRAAPSPGDAARMGRNLPGLRADWEDVKDEVMLVALRAKFGQHAKLKRLLLETGERPLVEHTTNDRYWADGGDGSGKNRLGALLMVVRDELRAAPGHR
ncbi:MAG: NADAR family protein [Anaeromyxobacter sp.]